MKEIITSYYDWLKENTKINTVGDYFEEVTPFLDNRNDSLLIYHKSLPDGTIEISDGGFIMDEFGILSIDISKGKRKQIFEHILRSYHLDLVDDELIIKPNESNYSKNKHFFIQGLLKLEDMYLLNRTTVRSTFQEDVLEYITKEDITYLEDIKISGKSKLDHNIDLILPGKETEAIVKLANNIDFNMVKSHIFTFEDIQGSRKKESKCFVLINDINKNISDKYTDAFNEYNIKPLIWSDKDALLHEFKNVG